MSSAQDHVTLRGRIAQLERDREADQAAINWLWQRLQPTPLGTQAFPIQPPPEHAAAIQRATSRTAREGA